jgi:hypothetical protein
LHQRLRYENPVNACTYYFQWFAIDSCK